MFLFKKIIVCCFSALLIVTLSFSNLFATTLIGKITGINGDEFYIEMSSKELPRKGDPVSIILDLDGEGFEAGKAEVIEASKSKVTAKTTEGSASIDMKVLIQTGRNLKKKDISINTNAPALHRCDELTADPNDDNHVGPTVKYDDIDAAQAIRACKDAVKEYPGTVRFIYQLSRAFVAGKEQEKKMHYLKKAIELEYPAAINEMGRLYVVGENVSKDYDKALKWIRRAAELGESVAIYNLGYMYRNGKGVTEDHEQAVIWYIKAAGQGFAQAQYVLGWMNEQGEESIAKDEYIAAKWYRKAAEQGHKRSQYRLGRMYDNGNGVSEDDREAAKWYRKAAAQDNEQAKKILAELEN